MFVDEKIEIIVLNATKKYYKNLGYDISNKRIYVKIEDIPKESHLKTKCLCDKCDTETFISIASYYKNYNRGGFFTCKKCSIEYKTKKTNIIKYGVDNPMKNKDINNKAKETLMNNWGVDVPLKNKDIRNSYKNTMNYLYGVDHALQNEKIKDKIKKTNLERYGVEYASQSIIFKNKTKNTNLQRYDVEYVYQSEYFKKIKLNSYDEKWGGIMPQKHDVVKNKIIKSKNIKDEKKIIDLLEYSDYKLEKYKSYELEISHNSKNHIFSINTKNMIFRVMYQMLSYIRATINKRKRTYNLVERI
jgi:transcription elongation factor Elf1